MTTRITLTILLTTWVVLLLGEAGAFYTARQSLFALFDYNLINRAMTSLEAELAGGKPSLPAGDEYTRAEPLTPVPAGVDVNVTVAQTPTVERRKLPNGQNQRVLRLTMLAAQPDGQSSTYTVSYARPTERVDQLLTHMGGTLLLICLACGIVTAWFALKLSRDALRPLRQTADIIARIDERKLGTRIDPSKMPIELEPMAKRLNEMLERLQHVFQQRKQFLADAAHELRTPTAALLTTLEVAVRRPRDHAALLETLQSGLADARRLRRLVDSLMERARSDVERPMQVVEHDVAALLRECVQIVKPLAGEKNVTIAIDEAVPASLPFLTQPDRLRSVVLNLLSNAIEYNRDGGSVEVLMEREKGNENGNETGNETGDGVLKLSIRDTGVGISREQLPHVFEPFYRGGAAGDDAQHLGLGLFLVRSHVEALHGQCRADSALGRGTTMHITLPGPNSQKLTAEARQTAPATAASAGL